MNNFNNLLEKTGEVGYVRMIVNEIVYADGLPSARPGELIIFENGERGKVLSLSPDSVEILAFSKKPIKVGGKVARTGSPIAIPVGTQLLGKIIDPFGSSFDNTSLIQKTRDYRSIEVTPLGIMSRRKIIRQLETGVGIVDIMLPIGHGQRQLVIGDRKTGKTNFLLQTIVSAARAGNICIYTAIGKKKIDIKKVEEYFKENKVTDRVIIIASTSQDPSGVIFIAPYSAMTIAEYFRDRGQNTLLILDDLSTHAKFYREISLLANKFPGRNSYPGDIFYVHARLLERAGSFTVGNSEVAITCLPVVETPQADFSGYIKTNIMSMTDGHILFDSGLFAEGRRPAINPFLSVTRVGKQTQSAVKRSVNRELLSFLTLYTKLRNFSHFGAEATESVQVTTETGERVLSLFDQDTSSIIPSNIQIILLTLLWAGHLNVTSTKDILDYKNRFVKLYETNPSYKEFIDTMLDTCESFNELLSLINRNKAQVFPGGKL